MMRAFQNFTQGEKRKSQKIFWKRFYPSNAFSMRLLLILLAVFMVINISAVINWQLYTNTTHVYDILLLENKLYLATWGGLVVYDFETDSFIKNYSIKDGLQDIDIRAVSYMSSSETLLLGTFKAGINRMKNAEFLIPINQVTGLPTEKINAIVNSDSLIFVGTDQGLTVLKDAEQFPYPLPTGQYGPHNGLTSNQVKALALSDDGYLICGTNNGLNYVHLSAINDPAAWQHFFTDNSPLPGNFINAVSVIDNTIVAATRGGLARIDNINTLAEWSVFHQDNSLLLSNEIISVFIDGSDNIWFSYGVWDDNLLNISDATTQRTAITKISSDGSFQTWSRDNWMEEITGLKTSKFKGFFEKDNTIYAYSWDAGFYFLQDNVWHNRQPNSIVASNITDIAIDEQGYAWIVNGFEGSGVNRKGTRGVSAFDGEIWTNYTARYSPINESNIIFRVAVDKRNRKWFGSWGFGITVFDEDKDQWYVYTDKNGLNANEIGEITTDRDGNIWISNYSGGIFVLDIDAVENPNSIEPIASFQIYDPLPDFSDVIKIHHTSDKIFFGCYNSGIRYWDSPTIPQSYQAGDFWRKPPVATDTHIYGIESRVTHFGEEVWIAAESGLYTFDTNSEYWYRYGTTIKRERWSGNQWQRDRLYFVDEERLFGAAPTFPTAILIDPFNRIWIGSEANGITVYDLDTDRYTIYNTDNSPLISNRITTLEYEPYSGNLYIGTDEGLHTVVIGRLYKEDDVPLSKTVAFPNPFKPDEGETIVIANRDNSYNINDLPQGKNTCRIYNLNGDLVITLEEDSFFRFSWNGNNSSGNKCGSGVYFYVVSSEKGEVSKGTIVLIR
jgi:ligand-binding sensor domain-containing protein